MHEVTRFKTMVSLFVFTVLLSHAASFAEEYQPKLFKSMELVYEENFEKDGPHENPKQWTIRQETQWNVKDGILVGEPAKEEYQKKMQALNDVHEGTRPVIFLKPVPKSLVHDRDPNRV